VARCMAASSLFLLALSVGELSEALTVPALESQWGLAVTLGILALPAGVLAVLFGVAAGRRER